MEHLLHVPNISLSHYHKSVLPHLLNAAKRLIPIYWKKTYIPDGADWIRLVNDIMAAEEWMPKCKGRYDKFDTIWATWIHYTGRALLDSQPADT